MTAAPPITLCEATSLRLRRVLRVHFDPTGGSRFWLARADRLGIDPRRDVADAADLCLLGDLRADELRRTPLHDLVPASLWHERHSLRVVQTGGTTGPGAWTCYRDDEFDEAFVAPFVAAAKPVDFPRGGRWLYVGPSGPHVIGLAASAIARATGSATPFCVDFDPRWAAKSPPDSFARRRYVDHVLQQALDVLAMQEIDVLFATPPMLLRLAGSLDAGRRRAISGVHYGGMRVTAEALDRLRNAFPSAVHLAGYGNTLLGCCLPLVAGEAPPTYFPYGSRLIFEAPDGDAGPLRVTRLDESMLLVRLVERDVATLAAPPHDAPAGFCLPGVHDPRPPADRPQLSQGIY